MPLDRQFAFGYENSELLNSRCVSKECISEEFIYVGDFVGRTMLFGKIDESKSRGESSAEFGGSLIEFSDSNAFMYPNDSKAMVNLGFKEVSQNSTKESASKENDKVNYYFHIFFPMLTFYLGCIVTGIYCLFCIDKFFTKQVIILTFISLKMECYHTNE